MAILPEGFSYLSPFVEPWGSLDSQAERYLHRQRSDLGSLRNFYDAVAPQLEEIFTHLDRFPVGEPLPEPEALLFRLSLGLLEAAQAIECYGQPSVPHAPADQLVSIEATQF